MPKFQQIPSGDDIKEVLKSAYDIDLPISGGWGYDEENPTILETSKQEREHLQFTFASVRAHIQMNLTQQKENRYGGINLKEIDKKELLSCQKVTYEITGMLESDYAKFIKEYKENFQSANFDIAKHFEDRKKATITLKEDFYFRESLIIGDTHNGLRKSEIL